MSLPYHKPPPYERANWGGMNEGQRRYAMEQYNLALVRRGAKFNPPQDDASDEEPFDIDNFVNNRYDDLGVPPEHQGASQDHQVTGEDPTSQENAAADNFLNQLEDRLPHLSPLPSPLSPMESSQESQSSQVSSSQGSKRGPEGTQGPPAKKGKASTSGSALPGTSGNTDGMVGGAVNGARQSARIEPIHRGITSHKITLTYTKRWKFLSFGIADQILDDTTHGGRWALTTSLANIPWEYAFFYMSPAEFAQLQSAYRGVFAKHCNVSVSQFNPRVAFQTADTTSTTATLNQNKFTRWVTGIRSNAALYCSDRDYVYDATEPMKPTGFDTPTPRSNRLNLVRAMYGVANTSTVSQHNASIPAYATGQELELQQYLTIYTPKTGDFGFPPYDQYCQEGNSMDYLGQEIINKSHTFEYAPLQKKHSSVFDTNLQDSATQNVDVMCGSRFEGGWVKELPVDRGQFPIMVNEPDLRYTQQTEGTNVDNSNFNSDRPYYKFPMEQNGTYLELNRKPMAYSNHESIHVGVRAVPKLTTNANLIQTDSWLDTQIYWIVQATLTVEAVDNYCYIRGGATNMPSNLMMVHCNKSSDPTPVFTPLVQTQDVPYICGRRPAVLNTAND